jgi:hypothetical protein
MWIEHKDIFYNLDHYTQICRGDDDEILLSIEIHNMEWEDEEKHASLKFESKEDRDLALTILTTKLNVKLI